MVMTVMDVEKDLRAEMAMLSFPELVSMADAMGVETSDCTFPISNSLKRKEIEDACVAQEQYCYVR
jgi:hypothetical protein